MRGSEVFSVVAGTLLAVSSAWGLINPRYTPADLVRDANQVFVLAVRAPEKEQIAAKFVESLKGAPPAAKEMTLDLSAAAEETVQLAKAAFADGNTATAVVFVGNFANASATGGNSAGGAKGSSAAVQIGLKWFSLSGGGKDWKLDKDSVDLNAVWAGSAEMLVRAVKYATSGPPPEFPVQSSMRWGSEMELGKVDGARGCLVVEGLGPAAGGAVPSGVLVLAKGGDRLILAGADGGKPRDATEKAKLTTASLSAAVGDFNGDGRLDIASWDGAALKLAIQAADGTFAVQTPAVKLKDCLSLAAIDVDGKASLVAATSGGPVVLAGDGKGGFAPQPLEAPDNPKAGTPVRCVAADLDGDGKADVLELFTKGYAVRTGEGGGRFKRAAVRECPMPAGISSVLVGDYGADGRLDALVLGTGGVLLSGGPGKPLANIMACTGELDYHGMMNEPAIVAASPVDVNSDGRPGATLFYAERPAMTFFNRGFACFGFARELNMQEGELKAIAALAKGQTAGAAADLNGDGVADLLAVNKDGEMWVVFGQAEGRPNLGLTIALPPQMPGPVTVTAAASGRPLGAWTVNAGQPAYIGRTAKGPVTLEWTAADGKRQSQTAVVIRNVRVELKR